MNDSKLADAPLTMIHTPVFLTKKVIEADSVAEESSIVANDNIIWNR